MRASTRRNSRAPFGTTTRSRDCSTWAPGAPAGPPVHPVAASPAGGPVVSYWLKRPAREVVLEFMDAKGKLIKSFTSKQDSVIAADSVTRAARTRTRVDSLTKTGISADSAERLVRRTDGAGAGNAGA